MKKKTEKKIEDDIVEDVDAPNEEKENMAQVAVEEILF